MPARPFPVLPDTLPFRPEPADGESFLGYLLRSAAAVRLTVPELVHAVGLASRPGISSVPPAVGLFLDRRQVRSASHALRLDPARVGGMLLDRFSPGWSGFDPEGFPSGGMLLHAVRCGRLLTGWTRCCPLCLQERPGVWELRWRLVAVTVCPSHRVLLADRCAGCGEPPLKSGSTSSARPAALRGAAALDPGRVPDPGSCPLPDGTGGRCGAPFADAPTVPADGRLVDAQHAVLDAVARDDPTASDDLHALATLWAATADADEVAALPTPPPDADGLAARVLSLPGGTSLTAAAFAWAVDVRGDGTLDGGDRDGVGGRLTRLAPVRPVTIARSPLIAALRESHWRAPVRPHGTPHPHTVSVMRPRSRPPDTRTAPHAPDG